MIPRILIATASIIGGAFASAHALNSLESPMALGVVVTAVGTFGIALPVCGVILALGDG